IVKEGDPGAFAFTFYLDFKCSLTQNEEVLIQISDIVNTQENSMRITTSKNRELDIEINNKTLTPVFKELENRHVIEICKYYLNELENLVGECDFINSPPSSTPPPHQLPPSYPSRSISTN
ncbi:MAG: hypothetical protein AABX39_03015, partial [Nanoarchaeota archaeon]